MKKLNSGFANTLKLITILLLTLFQLNAYSQGVGINNPTPDAKALLDLVSTNKGLLIPRMTTAQRTALAFLPNATAYPSGDGMLVYDVTLKAFMHWNSNNSRWDTLLTSTFAKGTLWSLIGNAATNPAVNYLGTSDSIDMVLKTNGRERLRVKANGVIYTNSVTVPGVGINNATPDAKALMDMSSTTKGLLIPRMSTLQRTTLLPNAVAYAGGDGMLVYDNSLKAFMHWNSTNSRWDTLLNATFARAKLWSLIGNTATNPATNFVGNTDSIDLVFRTNNAQRLRIFGNGIVSINNATPNAKAILDIKSANRGLLIPRMTTAQRTAATYLQNGIANAGSDGMLTYDTDMRVLMLWNGTTNRWDSLMTLGNSNGQYWKLVGNLGTIPGTNYIGTNDNTDLVFKTNGLERLRIKANGQIFTNNQGTDLLNNIFFGENSGNAATTGAGNSALGSNSLTNVTSGANNTAVGIGVLEDLTTGSGNTAVGEKSGKKNSTGYGNTAMGRYSMYNNESGFQNVAIGDSALSAGTPSVGNYNVAVGFQALLTNQGSFNVAIGYQSAKNNLTGNRNVAVGFKALNKSTTGYNNVSIGNSSMELTTSGYRNVAVGDSALYSNTSGVNNVTIGTQAGHKNTLGSYNVFAGFQSGYANIDGDENVAIGNRSLFRANNSLANKNVAIGILSLWADSMPQENVAIGYASMLNSKRSETNVAIGSWALSGLAATAMNTDSNVAIGYRAASLVTSATNNVVIGTNSGRNLTAGISNVLVGTKSGYLLKGSNNIGIGSSALNNAKSATTQDNVAIGNEAISADTMPTLSVAIGRYAMRYGMLGTHNVAIGHSAIEGISGTTNNVNNVIAIGYLSGQKVSTAADDVFIGTMAGNKASSASNNVFVGTFSGFNTTSATDNVFLGNNSGYNNTTGIKNIALGYNALYKNSNGFENIGIGWSAAFDITTGTQNVAIGTTALHHTTIGHDNVAVGESAGAGIGAGNYNIAFGSNAMENARNSTVVDNISAGFNSLQADTIPIQNIALGRGTLQFGQTHTNNVAIGYWALRGGVSGGNNQNANVAIGFRAGYSTGTTGSGAYQNTFVGEESGHNNTSGFQNTFLGENAGYNNVTGFFNVAVGSESNIGNAGTFENISIGRRAGLNLSTGTRNTIVGSLAGGNISTGVQNTIIGSAADVSVLGGFVNATAIGYNAIVNANNKVRLGNTLVTVIEGQPLGYTGISDGRFKKNIVEDVKGLEFILRLRPVSYNMDRLAYSKFVGEKQTDEYLNELAKLSNVRQAGFIAQEMEKAVEQSNFSGFDGVTKPEGDNGTYGIVYSSLVVPLVKSVQELDAKNKLLKEENELLKIELDEIKERLQAEVEKLNKKIEEAQK